MVQANSHSTQRQPTSGSVRHAHRDGFPGFSGLSSCFFRFPVVFFVFPVVFFVFLRISPPLPFRICADLFACCPILVSSVSELCLVLGEFAQRTLSCFGSELCLVLGSRATESVPRLNTSVYLHTSRLWRPRLRAPLWPIFIW